MFNINASTLIRDFNGLRDLKTINQKNFIRRSGECRSEFENKNLRYEPKIRTGK